QERLGFCRVVQTDFGKRQSQLRIDLLLKPAGLRFECVFNSRQQRNRLAKSCAVIERFGMGQPILDFVLWRRLRNGLKGGEENKGYMKHRTPQGKFTWIAVSFSVTRWVFVGKLGFSNARMAP